MTETPPATQPSRVFYTAEATATGGRRGHGRTSDGRVEVDYSSPTELGGDGGPGTNPEQLFALGYSACYQNAMMGVARRMKLVADDSTVTARVGIGLVSEGRLVLTVDLRVTLPSIADRATAEQLIEAADKRCPYSNALRGNVPVTLTLD